MTDANILQPPVHRWECPSCGARHVTRETRPHTPMHPCPRLSGLQAPYVAVPRGGELTRFAARHLTAERGDYVGTEKGLVTVDGRPVMAVITERADGSNDCTVFAPSATATGDM